MRKTLLFCFYLFVVSCNRSVDHPTRQDLTDAVQESESVRQDYYRRVPDAPLDLYWFINERITPEIRLELCEHIMTNLSGNLTADVGIIVEDGKLIKAELVNTLYFDNYSIAREDTVTNHQIRAILNKIDTKQIPTLKDIDDADFAIRIQMERFCSGYVRFSGPTTVDSIAKALRDKNK